MALVEELISNMTGEKAFVIVSKLSCLVGHSFCLIQEQ